MRKLLSKLWADDGGFIVSIELLFIAVILVIGLIAGWVNLRKAVFTEFTALGNAILALNVGYQIDGISGDTGGSEGSNVVFNTNGIPQLQPPTDLWFKAASTTDAGVPLLTDLVP